MSHDTETDPQPFDPLDPALLAKARHIAEAIPEGGLFAEKAWRISPIPLFLTKREAKALDRLGPQLLKFQQVSDTIYRRSRKARLPEWISATLDQGKPPELLELGLTASVVEQTPRVIRPDLILTDDGFIASELDSVPGGIGLTAWLADVYSDDTDPNRNVIGGREGMIKGFGQLFGGRGADIAVSEEASDYRPEMDWIRDRLGDDWSVVDAESYSPTDRPVYRFFELFDLPNLIGGRTISEAAAAGTIDLTAPIKPWLEEKAWSALFWSLPLRELWKRELRESNWRRLCEIFPRSWIVDPAEVPPHAGIPGLDIQHFEDLSGFTQTERELVLKLSGFDERAWGSRSVTMGHDVSAEDWGKAVDEALSSYGTSPFVLQRFHAGRIIKHPWWNPETDQLELMEGRARLCPYYFIDPTRPRETRLGGILATICPSDKKILHGMSDAILVPCAVGS
ncbi:MAG: hypothetical protein AAF236_03570 [Verrucomicrobiota bacterium]